jgi:hypothetical protein
MDGISDIEVRSTGCERRSKKDISNNDKCQSEHGICIGIRMCLYMRTANFESVSKYESNAATKKNDREKRKREVQKE